MTEFTVTPDALDCDASPVGASFELAGPGATLAEGSEELIWYAERTGSARFCLAPGACSEVAGARWNVETTPAPDRTLSVAVACMDARGMVATLMRGTSLTICGPTTITCP